MQFDLYHEAFQTTPTMIRIDFFLRLTDDATFNYAVIIT